MPPLKFQLTSWLFIRCLGVVYFFAFFSIASQILGLLGEHGILPAQAYLNAIQTHIGLERFWFFPTLFWVNASDAMLQIVSALGCLAALLVVCGVLVGPGLLLLWLLYLSVIAVGQDFLSFQWDILLAETGFLAIFLLPWRKLEPWLKGSQGRDPDFQASPVILWLLRLLIFKLMLQSGLVKILSGDSTWASLTALNFHYFTQPLPTPLAYIPAHFPSSFNRVCCAVMLATEILVPFTIFLGRYGRIFAAFAFIFLQVLILLTGNYAFFNLLTISLCLILLDDRLFVRILPGSLSAPWRLRRLPRPAPFSLKRQPRRLVLAAVTALIGLLTAGHIVGVRYLPSQAVNAMQMLSSFYFVSSYGLFAVMTTERDEIIVEGSNDGENWLPYEFKYKPGDPNRAPPMVAPFQPRLDWQMWFASLGSFEANPWFTSFVVRLLEGSPDVLRLLAKNPFPASPPKYIRAEFYRYSFTEPDELSKTGAWWKREFVRYYLPPIGIRPSIE